LHAEDGDGETFVGSTCQIAIYRPSGERSPHQAAFADRIDCLLAFRAEVNDSSVGFSGLQSVVLHSAVCQCLHVSMSLHRKFVLHFSAV